MSKKLIGLVANFNHDEGRFWINANYVRYYNTYGQTILIDPMDTEINQSIDLLVMPGGADISSLRYGVPHSIDIGMPNRPYEMFDYYTLPSYLAAGCPILGVCRGFQSLNVYFGGKLNPHAPEHPNSQWDGEVVHAVGTEDRNSMFLSSSNHHQTVTKDGLSDQFTPLLYSYEIEKVKHDKKWHWEVREREDIVEAMIKDNIFAHQFHPEKNYCSAAGESTCKELDAWVREMVKKIM